MPNPVEVAPRRPSLLFPLLIFLAAMAFLVLSGDARAFGPALAGFPVTYLAPLLGLSLLNYGLRVVRWQIYLRRVGVSIGLVPSATVFASGMAMAVTPGKAGELVKAYGLKTLTSAPVASVVSVILMERVNDTVGVLLLAGIGSYSRTLAPLLVIAATLLLFHGVLLWPRPARALLVRALALGPLPRVRDRVLVAFESLRVLGDPRLVLGATCLSLLAWGAEGAGLGLVIRGLGGSVPLSAAVMTYAVATLAGAVSFLPGGLLVTEGSMAAMLHAFGLDRTRAALATSICRFATLWFAVALGGLVFSIAWPRMLRAATAAARVSEAQT